VNDQRVEDKPAAANPEPPPLEPAREQALRALFEQTIPFHQHLGLRCGRIRAGAVTVELPPRAEHVGDPWRPALHGGVVATLIDVAGGLAVFSQVGREDRVSTVDLRVDYLLPAETGRPLFADARLLRAGGRSCMAEVNVHHGDPNKPVARGAAVFNVLRRSEPA
jgi:uncharacterized protein (TIGR00369 family)